jgi:FkbH-like protein
VVFLERLEDLCGEAMVDPYGPGMLTFQRNLEDYLSAIQRARHKLNGFFIVATFAPSSRSVLTSADGLSSEGFQAMAEYGNRRLAEVVKGIEAACILDLSSVLMKSGLKARDRKYWYIGRIPFGQETQNTIARRLAGICLARQGKSARMLVIDLDNTLWGGVVGEEGLEGIRVGGDYPGNAYRDFQRVLKFLKERGVILAIASKNTETIALEAIDLHPEMVLARDDFTLWRINWQDKANNIRSICDEIGLSPATVCFLDDNPRERAWVKSQIPDMYVPDLPEDPGERPQFLLELPCLETVELTAEDRHRADQYRAEQNLKVQRQTYENIEDFYRSLNMVMTPCAYSRTNKARILQLIAKTNQFNTTTKRYSETELGKLISVEGQVFAIKLKDLFRQEEIIGVLILEWQPGVCRIDSFLLSCRVLGYGVETAVLAWLSQMAQARSVERLVGTIVETPRNQVVRSLYLDHGFKAIEKGEFELLLSSSRIECPAWICLETDLVETGVLDEG